MAKFFTFLFKVWCQSYDLIRLVAASLAVYASSSLNQDIKQSLRPQITRFFRYLENLLRRLTLINAFNSPLRIPQRLRWSWRTKRRMRGNFPIPKTNSVFGGDGRGRWHPSRNLKTTAHAGETANLSHTPAKFGWKPALLSVPGGLLVSLFQGGA